MMDTDTLLAIAQDLVAAARRAGADSAEASCGFDATTSAGVRLGRVEDLTRAESADIGLRVFVGQQSARVSASDLSASSRAGIVERALEMARATPPDLYAGLVDPGLLAKGPLPETDLADDTELSAERMVELAREAEDAARAVPRVTNSEGAGFSRAESLHAYVNTHGFAHAERRTRFGISASVLAESGAGKQRDYAYHSTRFYHELDKPEDIGRQAGERTVARLDPIKLASGTMPILFDPRVSSSLLGHLTGAISGLAIARHSSFLIGKLGQCIFQPEITVLESPHTRRGLRSRTVDSEGVATCERALIDNGRLTTWLVDAASGRQLGMTPTGHAAGSGVSVSNLALLPGLHSPGALMADIKTGLYVTELIGMGVNGVTGDYSRGASGFLIQDGNLAHPVAEITIAGHLLAMFATMQAADDLDRRTGIDAPTVRIEGMTVAGN